MREIQESGLAILLVGEDDEVGGQGPLADEVARALGERGASIEHVAARDAVQTAFVHAPDLIVLIGDAVADAGAEVLGALAAKGATSSIPVVLVRGDRASGPLPTSRGALVASVARAAPSIVATRVVEIATRLRSQTGNAALRALLTSGPKKSGARVIVPTPETVESEGVDTAQVVMLPAMEEEESLEMPSPEGAKPKIVPFVPTERFGTIDLPFEKGQLPVDNDAPTDLYEKPVPLVADKSELATQELPRPLTRRIEKAPSKVSGPKIVPPSRRRAVGREMRLEKNPPEPATSIRPTEVDLQTVGASRAISTQRYERVVPPASRTYIAAAVVLALAIVGGALFVHANLVASAPTVSAHAIRP